MIFSRSSTSVIFDFLRIRGIIPITIIKAKVPAETAVPARKVAINIIICIIIPIPPVPGHCPPSHHIYLFCVCQILSL